MSFETLGFEDLEKELEQLGNIDDIAPAMLEVAAPILKEELQNQVLIKDMQMVIWPDP